MKCPKCGGTNIKELSILYPNMYCCVGCNVARERSYFERVDVKYQGNVVEVSYVENGIAYQKKYSQKEFADLGTSTNIIKDLKKKPLEVL